MEIYYILPQRAVVALAVTVEIYLASNLKYTIISREDTIRSVLPQLKHNSNFSFFPFQFPRLSRNTDGLAAKLVALKPGL